jgi:hypothetical protein
MGKRYDEILVLKAMCMKIVVFQDVLAVVWQTLTYISPIRVIMNTVSSSEISEIPTRL